jgi:hypothetical protein
MAPASTTHGRVQATLARLLGNHLLGTGCDVVIAPGVIPRVRAEAGSPISPSLVPPTTRRTMR